MSNLIAVPDMAEAYGLDSKLIRTVLEKAGVKPAYERGKGSGCVRLYNVDDVNPVLVAKKKEVEAKKAPPTPTPMPAPTLTMQDSNIPDQIRAVFGNTEILRHRLEDLVRETSEVGFRSASDHSRLVHLEEMAKGFDEYANQGAGWRRTMHAEVSTTRNEFHQLRQAFDGMQEAVGRLFRQVQEMNANNGERSAVLETLIKEQGGVPTQLEVLGNRMNVVLSRLPLPTPPAGAPAPAFPEPKPRPKRALVYGLNSNQEAHVRDAIDSGWDLFFINGESKTSDAQVKAMLGQCEFLLCLKTFRGGSPEALAKSAGKPCIRVLGGVAAIVDYLIERL